MKISRVETDSVATGESPLWDVTEQVIYFVDVLGKLVLRYDPNSGETRRWSVPGIVGSMALRECGGAIIALEDGIYRFDFETNQTAPLALVPHEPRIQFNDGKVDRRGRFLVGTFDWKMTDPIGKLFRLELDGSLQMIDDNFVCGNGPCWSPDNRTFYHCDSKIHTIYAYDYDLDTGTVANRRVFANTQELGGLPDGVTVDRDGFLWVAVPPGAKVVCYHPSGKIERIVDMPVQMPASVMFGGKDLDLLFVTSIDPSVIETVEGSPRVRASRRNRDAETETGNGSLFVIEGLGARGLAEPRYKG